MVRANKEVFAGTIIALAPSYVFTTKNGKVIQPDIEHLFVAAKRDGYIIGWLRVRGGGKPIKMLTRSYRPPLKIFIAPDGGPPDSET
jgi:hypothetical protein